MAQKMALGYRLRAWRTVVACSSRLALAMAAASGVGGIVVSMVGDLVEQRVFLFGFPSVELNLRRGRG